METSPGYLKPPPVLVGKENVVKHIASFGTLKEPKRRRSAATTNRGGRVKRSDRTPFIGKTRGVTTQERGEHQVHGARDRSNPVLTFCSQRPPWWALQGAGEIPGTPHRRNNSSVRHCDGFYVHLGCCTRVARSSSPTPTTQLLQTQPKAVPPGSPLSFYGPTTARDARSWRGRFRLA